MEPVNTQETQEQATQVTPKPEEAIPDTIIIRMWPKTPVLYPVAVFALICSIVGSFSGFSPNMSELKTAYEAQMQASAGENVQQETVEAAQIETEAVVKSMLASLYIDRVMGAIFLVLLAFTLFTLCLDLEVRWAMVIFSILITLILLIYIANSQYNFLPTLFPKLFILSPLASPQFYFTIFLIWAILMIISMFIIRFHYVKIESNEIIVVGGLLQREQRFSTNRMYYTKDIQDVFEYYLPLVNSGRLIISFSDHPESIVIDNVLNINKVTKLLDEITGVMQVRS